MLEKTSKNTATKILISWILVIIWASVIFYLSSKSAPESTVQSQTIINSFAEILGTVIEDEEMMTSIDGIVRESAHGIEYFILGMLVFNALFTTLNYRKQEELLLTAETGVECTDRFRAINCMICACIVCSIYALSDEIHQIPIPGRTFELLDLAIDFTGIVLGIIAISVLYKIRNKK